MEEPIAFLQNPRKAFRTVLPANDHLARAAIRVRVIGYRMPMMEIVHTPCGMEDYFLYFFDRPVDIGTARGRYPNCPPSLVISSPGALITHAPLAGERTPPQRSWVRASGPGLTMLLEKARVPIDEPIPFPSLQLNERFLFDLYAELQHPAGADPYVVELLFRLWIRQIARHCHPPARHPIPETILRIRRYLESHFDQKLNLQQLADRFHRSPSWITRHFREAFQSSPAEYLISLRIDQSLDLLADPQLTLESIAARCGFRDAYYFSRMFKARIGLPPRQYQRSLSQGDVRSYGRGGHVDARPHGI